MSYIDSEGLTFNFVDWQDEDFSKGWTNGRLGYPKDRDVGKISEHYSEKSSVISC